MTRMRTFGLAVLLALAVAGCAGGSKSNAPTHGTGSVAPKSGGIITILGPVAHPQIPYNEGLVLSRALMLAGYQNQGRGRVVVIRKEQQPMYMQARALLNGDQDIVLEPGDRIEIQP